MLEAWEVKLVAGPFHFLNKQGSPIVPLLDATLEGYLQPPGYLQFRGDSLLLRWFRAVLWCL
jgi:hypothetical protein